MGTICRYLWNFYEEIIDKQSDPRVEHLFLMSSPFQIIGLLVCYVNFVNKWGPALMKSREAFDLKYIMILYDIIQIILNGYLFYMCIKVAYVELGYSFICQEVDYSDEPVFRFIASRVWLFFFIKVVDLLDTVFMVLRKKQSQISFLHVYHHTGMAFGSWVATKYFAGGHIVTVGFINSFVHTVMYLYYLLTAIDSKYKKSIWWKKHLTELQMVQFIIFAWHSAVVIFNPSCKFPKLVMGIFFPQNFFMLIMFWDFYRKNYLSKKSSAPANVNESNTGINNNDKEKIKDTSEPTKEPVKEKQM